MEGVEYSSPTPLSFWWKKTATRKNGKKNICEHFPIHLKQGKKTPPTSKLIPKGTSSFQHFFGAPWHRGARWASRTFGGDHAPQRGTLHGVDRAPCWLRGGSRREPWTTMAAPRAPPWWSRLRRCRGRLRRRRPQAQQAQHPNQGGYVSHQEMKKDEGLFFFYRWKEKKEKKLDAVCVCKSFFSFFFLLESFFWEKKSHRC